MGRRMWMSAVVAVAVVAAGMGVASCGGDDYELNVLMPDASGMYVGGKVMLRGRQIGEVTEVGVRGDQALATAVLESEHAPVPSGTSARISWESVIGKRVLELLPGSEANPSLPSGRMIESTTERVEIDDLLATLDKPTRERLRGFVSQLGETLQGREEGLNRTVKAAGPAADAIGEVMRAVGEDGPAIRELVTRLAAMTRELAQRDNELGQTVANLGRFASTTADRQEALAEALTELPPTVREATATLDKVPSAVEAAGPLLRDLRPATEQLPSMAANLHPVLTDLRLTAADLKPTLHSTEDLLGHTPGLLDSAHATLPDLNEAITTLQPAIEFLRPYTPELTGWLSNWTGVFASENGAGNYSRAHFPVSASSFNGYPVGVLAPGLIQDPRPAPGSLVGQPWTDANGDGMR